MNDKMLEMETPKDDSFAPRPKLSWNMRVTRASAFLAAVGISLIFLFADWFVITDPQQFTKGGGGPSSPTEKLLRVVVLTLVQIMLLLPCWRAWMLRRWACFVLLFIVFMAFAFSLLDFGAAVSVSALILVMFLSVAIKSEWPHLKSGF